MTVRFFMAFVICVLLRMISLQWWSQTSETGRVLVGLAPAVPAVVLWPCAPLTVAAKLGNLLELPHLCSVNEALVSFYTAHILWKTRGRRGDTDERRRRQIRFFHSCRTEGGRWKLYRSRRCIWLLLRWRLAYLVLGWVLLSKKKFIIKQRTTT